MAWMKVLEVKSSYAYTIPSFCAIKMDLQHVVVRYQELHNISVMDAFFRTEAVLPGFSRSLPATVDVITGCVVPVSHMYIL